MYTTGLLDINSTRFIINGAATACTGSGGQLARSLFLAHLPDESRACAARKVSAAHAWVANQVQNGRSAPMRSMLLESRRHGHGQWPRWSVRMNWEHALAWAYRLAAGAIDRRGERRPWSSNPLVRTRSFPLLTCSFPSARRWPAGARRRLLGASPAPARCFGSAQDARRLLRGRDRSEILSQGSGWAALVRASRGVDGGTAGARKTGQIT